ncbi:MAG TPA: transglycosylase domain-containing protein, partial [Vitreimonas sp.]|nr:transglycosylase domain-containing protein [Vitreimonas sp.]
ARAEQGGALGRVRAGRLSTAEYTVAMNEFRETWRSQAMPCRTLANLWADLTNESAPDTLPVSHKFAGTLMGERRQNSIRWQVRRYIVSCQLEQRFDDRQLLRLWLDEASFGGDLMGIEPASQAIFNKPSSALNRNESARLAALLRAPSLRGQPERWTERAGQIEARVAGPAQ